jgi:hypothetical protein
MCKAMRAVLRSDAILIEDGEAGKVPLARGQDYRIWPRSEPWRPPAPDSTRLQQANA